jgi:methyl-accepting chemotaxis protein
MSNQNINNQIGILRANNIEQYNTLLEQKSRLEQEMANPTKINEIVNEINKTTEESSLIDHIKEFSNESVHNYNNINQILDDIETNFRDFKEELEDSEEDLEEIADIDKQLKALDILREKIPDIITETSNNQDLVRAENSVDTDQDMGDFGSD